MRVALLTLAWSLGTMLALQSPIRAQAADSQLPVSIDRIRAGLMQPPSRLQLPPPSADTLTFRVEVRERPFVLHPVDDKPFDPTFGLPSVGDLLMNGIGHIGSAAVDAKHRRAQRRAQKDGRCPCGVLRSPSVLNA